MIKTYRQSKTKPSGKKLNRILRRAMRGHLSIGIAYVCPHTHLLKFREQNVEY